MATPIVSVLIPVYNVEEYLGKCLESVMAQTLNNIEIICVNDGSTDGSAEILEKYALLDKRIKIVTKENGGLPSARNAGLEVAKGKYIGFVDSDDYIEPKMYEILVENAEKNNSDVVICGANIFPETPRADQWLYDTLSPWYRHYDKFNSDVLFKMVDTTPFLWRTIISKRLIDSHNFRLDEDIVLGEDKAFQCKVYPYAKGITVIPDKLYNYYWCRPGSLMAENAYNNITVKVKKHVKLVISIADYIVKSELKREEKKLALKNYFDWSIPFIYSDYIYCARNDKIAFAKELMECFDKVGAMQYWGLWEEWKQQQYKYIKMASKKDKYEEPLLSVIVMAEYGDVYIKDAIKQIEDIASENIEIIVINNGMEGNSYIELLRVMDKNLAIRLHNTTKHLSYANMLNVGISLAKGKYISILETKDWYKSKELLIKWTNYAIAEGNDCCVSNHMEKEYRNMSSGMIVYAKNQSCRIWENDFHDVLYKTEFLHRNKLLFEELSVITGVDFWSRVVFAAGSIGFFDDYVYCSRKCWKQDWIKTEKIELILEGLEKLVKLSIEKNNAWLHGKVYQMLNSDELKHIIVNGTKMYHMPAYKCPNGENGQIKTLTLLYSLVQNVDTEMLKKAGFEEKDSIVQVLYEVISERQKFLASI